MAQKMEVVRIKEKMAELANKHKGKAKPSKLSKEWFEWRVDRIRYRELKRQLRSYTKKTDEDLATKAKEIFKDD